LQGRFIAFEGIDGSGKSTLVATAAQHVLSLGHKAWLTREETTGPTGEWVKRSIAERWDPLATTFLFLADRAQHVREIEVRRAAGEHVLCDRYLHSTLAYQSVTLRGRVPDVHGFLRGLHAGMPMPDHVVLLRVDPERAVSRLASRSSLTPYEKAHFLGQVQDEYLALARADRDRFTVIDANRPADAVASDVTALLPRLLS
jgi:dTMP kinase